MSKNIRKLTYSAKSRSKSEWWDEYFIANCIGAQTLIRQYLSPYNHSSWSAGAVEINATKVGNRTGVPRDATTWVYEFTGDEFNVTVRAVWRGNDLFGPIKTHTRLTQVSPNDEVTRRAFNQWLRSLSAI